MTCDCFTGGVAYETDILDDFAAQRRGPSYPDVEVEMGMLVEDRASHFCGDVVRWNAEGVTLQDRNDYIRHFGWKPGGFLIDGRPVTLVRPSTATARHATHHGVGFGRRRRPGPSGGGQPDLGRGQARRGAARTRVGRRPARTRHRRRTAPRRR